MGVPWGSIGVPLRCRRGSIGVPTFILRTAEDAVVIKLYAQKPPIAKLDNSLNNLKNCE